MILREPTKVNLFCVLLYAQGDTGGVRLDGQKLSGVTWYGVPGSSLSYTMFNIPVGQHFIDHVNTDTKMAAFIYGHAIDESYGMQAGASCMFLVIVIESFLTLGIV